jgi:hypothetical protein
VSSFVDVSVSPLFCAREEITARLLDPTNKRIITTASPFLINVIPLCENKVSLLI